MHVQQSSVVSSLLIESPSQRSVTQTEEALRRIASRPNGNALLQALDAQGKAGKPVKIYAAPPDSAMQNAARAVSDIHNPGDNNKRAVARASKGLFGKGAGASVEIDFNPNKSLALNAAGAPTGHTDDPQGAYLSLAHELVHAYRITKGTYTGGGESNGFDPNSRRGKEELRAVGLGKWASKPFSENSIRREHDEPVRQSYPRSREPRAAEFDPTARYQEPTEEQA